MRRGLVEEDMEQRWTYKSSGTMCFFGMQDLAGIFCSYYTGMRMGSWEFDLFLHEKPILFRFGLLL